MFIEVTNRHTDMLMAVNLAAIICIKRINTGGAILVLQPHPGNTQEIEVKESWNEVLGAIASFGGTPR